MGCGNVGTMEKENYNNQVSELDNKEIKIPDNKLKINTAEIKKTDNPKRKKMKEKMKKEMKEYQKLIQRKRKNLNKNGEYDDTSESEDSRLKYAKGKNFAKKRKKLTPEEIEDGIKQDEKEEEKRKNRKAYFSPIQKELPFKHKESEGSYDPITSKQYSFGYENEIYKGINYGKPIRFYNQTWLTYDAPVEPNSYGPRVQIPPGWRIPTLDDYKNLFKYIGDNEKIKKFLTNERLLNMKNEYLYITSDKVFPDDNNAYNSKAWTYFCIGFNFYDEVEYPGIEPLDNPNKQKKIISIQNDDNNNNIINTNTNNLNEENKNEEYDDAIISGDEDDFIKQMNKQLNKNREDYRPINEDDLRKKNRLYTPNFKSYSSLKIDEDEKRNKNFNEAKKNENEDNEEEKKYLKRKK